MKRVIEKEMMMVMDKPTEVYHKDVILMSPEDYKVIFNDAFIESGKDIEVDFFEFNLNLLDYLCKYHKSNEYLREINENVDAYHQRLVVEYLLIKKDLNKYQLKLVC